MEVILRIGNDVGGHAGKWPRERIEVEAVVIAVGEVAEEHRKVLSPEYSRRCRLLFRLQRDAPLEEVGILLLTLAEALISEVFIVGQHISPVLRPHEGVKLVGGIAYTVEPSHNAAHRGACYDVDGNARSLKHFEHPDVRHALGAAAGEHHGHLLALLLLCPAGQDGNSGEHEEQDEEPFSFHDDRVSVYCKYKQFFRNLQSFVSLLAFVFRGRAGVASCKRPLPARQNRRFRRSISAISSVNLADFVALSDSLEEKDGRAYRYIQ